MTIRRPSLFLGTLLLLLMQLSACGFHLRGAVPLPEQMQRTRIVGAERSELFYAVENGLINAGSEVVTSSADATAVLTLHSQGMQRRLLSVDAQGRAAEYELVLRVVFSLADRAGRRIADQERVEVVRDFSFDPDNVLARSEEEAALRSEMYRFAVEQMMRRLQSLARNFAAESGE